MGILITRPEPTASHLMVRLKNLGKSAWILPLIEFLPGRELKDLSKKLNLLNTCDLVFFMSQQAIKFAHPFLKESCIKWPRYLYYYAIGQSTAKAVYDISYLQVEYPTVEETSQALIKINSLKNIQGKNALILRGNSGIDTLANTLTARGATVQYCECYQRVRKCYNGMAEARRFQEYGISTIIVTSAEMLQQLFLLFSPKIRQQWLLHCTLLVVSDRLAKIANRLGWKNICIADGANNDDLIRALIQIIH